MDERVGLEGYRLMMMSRSIDDQCAKLLASGTEVPNYHGARGQEAIYAGCGIAVQEIDYLQYNYRGFATLLGKGVTIDELWGDLLLRRSGTSRGHGGIMHVVRPDKRLLGRNGVFGSKFGMAVGFGLALRMRNERGAVLSMFGEAEGNRGALYESLNMAVLERLPIVFVAENNSFAVAARTPALYAGGNMSSLVRGFGLPVCQVDGNDFFAVYSTMEEALRHSRAGGGPAFVELLTYRMDPHTAFDDDSLYRDSNEALDWRDRDPIERFERTWIAEGFSREALDVAREAAFVDVQAAMERQLDSPDPRIEGVGDYVYYESTA